MMDNFVVEEVHRIRQDLLTKHGGDLHALVLEAERFEIDPSIATEPFVVQDVGDDWDGSYSNPIVDEVHRIRAEMLAEQDVDVQALMQGAHRRDEKSAAKQVHAVVK